MLCECCECCGCCARCVFTIFSLCSSEHGYALSGFNDMSMFTGKLLSKEALPFDSHLLLKMSAKKVHEVTHFFFLFFPSSLSFSFLYILFYYSSLFFSRSFSFLLFFNSYFFFSATFLSVI